MNKDVFPLSRGTLETVLDGDGCPCAVSCPPGFPVKVFVSVREPILLSQLSSHTCDLRSVPPNVNFSCHKNVRNRAFHKSNLCQIELMKVI